MITEKKTQFLADELDQLRRQGLFRPLRVLGSAQDTEVIVDGKQVLNLSSNNYLGLTTHPRLKTAMIEATQTWGAGSGAVRTIAGTMTVHEDLERRLAEFKHTEASLVFQSGFTANLGVLQAMVKEGDVIISDELNHASIIDGARLCKAKRFRVPHDDSKALDRMLAEDSASRFRIMMTDGVFSMEGEEANLTALAAVCERTNTLLVVDDSHATGVLGKTGRGTAEEQGVFDRIPVTTGTLGKAMGSAAGGFVTGPQALIDLLRQRSRPYLFSNSLPPAVVAGSLEAFRLLREDPAPVAKLRGNAASFRKMIAQAGFQIPHGTHPIVPVIVGDTAKALAMGRALFEEGVYVSGFGFPVVPQGHARLRCQVSAAHEAIDLEQAVDVFVKVGRKFGLI